jgi:hypothetical protein
MIPDEQVARIRHLFHAEHWKIGTIAAELLLHPDTVRRALETDRLRSQPRLRTQLTDPYLDFLRQTLQQYPRLRATRLLQMIAPRGYTGSVTQLRRVGSSGASETGAISARPCAPANYFPRACNQLIALISANSIPAVQKQSTKTKHAKGKQAVVYFDWQKDPVRVSG